MACGPTYPGRLAIIGGHNIFGTPYECDRLLVIGSCGGLRRDLLVGTFVALDALVPELV